MPTSLGPNTRSKSSLVLSYDMANKNSYIGEPTTNLSYNNGQTDSQYLASTITWVNAGSWTQNTNETDVPKPIIPGFDTTNYRITSGTNTTAGGSVHYGCGFTTVSPSTTYTVSVWYRQNKAGIAQPYLRTNVTNISLGNLAYNGDTNSANWPVNQWIRISASGTTASNENGIYISNYIGTSVGDKIWYFGHQVEAKSHATALVAGSRSATEGISDLTKLNNNLTLANATYDANGDVYFDGSSGYIINSSFTSHQTDIGTISAWVYPTTTSGDIYFLGVGGTTTYGATRALRINSGNWSVVTYGSSTEDYNGIVAAQANTWQYVVMSWAGKNITFYFNTTPYTAVRTGMVTPQGSNLVIGATPWTPRYGYTPCKINKVEIYNSVLSQADINANFNQNKKRFNI